MIRSDEVANSVPRSTSVPIARVARLDRRRGQPDRRTGHALVPGLGSTPGVGRR